MSKLRALIISGVLVLVATVIMGSMYTMGSISYSYVTNDASLIDKVLINNITTIEGIDTTRLDGPTINGNDISLELDLLPYETYKFSFDLVNSTNVDYRLNKLLINCLNDERVNDYLTISMFYDNGEQVKDYSDLIKGTKRTVTVTISYDKNVEDIKTFLLDFDMDINPSAIR